MTQNKTKPNEKGVKEFLESVEPEEKRKDSFEILKLMKDISGEEPVMWGGSIVGFGKYHYKYSSGREGDWMKIGFSPRKNALTFYLMGSAYRFGDEIFDKLGKFTHGKGCLYIKKLDDVEAKTLRKIIKKSYESFSS